MKKNVKKGCEKNGHDLFAYKWQPGKNSHPWLHDFQVV